jgi:hypothetical protein
MDVGDLHASDIKLWNLSWSFLLLKYFRCRWISCFIWNASEMVLLLTLSPFAFQRPLQCAPPSSPT